MDFPSYLPDAANPRHRQLKRLIIATRDIQNSISALTAATDLKEEGGIRKHLISIAVVYYSRPFITTRGYARISTKLERFEDQSLKKMHDFLIAWRNTAVAHSDDELNDVGFIPKGSKIRMQAEGGKSIEFIMAAHAEVYRGPKFPSKHVPKFLTLCSFQESRIKADADREKDALFGEFIKPQQNPKT